MSMTLLERTEYAESRNFKLRFAMALSQKAQLVLQTPFADPENPTPLELVNRQFAMAILGGPMQYATSFAIGFASYAELSEVTPDAQIQMQVGLLWPAYAAAYAEAKNAGAASVGTVIGG